MAKIQVFRLRFKESPRIHTLYKRLCLGNRCQEDAENLTFESRKWLERKDCPGQGI